VNCLGMNLSRRSRLQGYTYFVQDIHCIRIRQVTVLSTGSRSPSPTVPLFLQTSNLLTRGHHMSYIPCTELPFPTDPGPASVAAAPTLDVFSQRKKKKLIRARRFRSTKKSAKPHYLVVNLNRGLGLASHSQCRCTTR